MSGRIFQNVVLQIKEALKAGIRLFSKSYLVRVFPLKAVLIGTLPRPGWRSSALFLLPPELRRRGLFPVGRLDKDSEGLLLLTNDGDLAHRLLSPKKHVDKVYYIRTDRPLTPEDQEAFASGVNLACKMFFLFSTKKIILFWLICEFPCFLPISADF